MKPIETNPNGHKGLIIAYTESYSSFLELDDLKKMTRERQLKHFEWLLSRLDVPAHNSNV